MIQRLNGLIGFAALAALGSGCGPGATPKMPHAGVAAKSSGALARIRSKGTGGALGRTCASYPHWISRVERRAHRIPNPSNLRELADDYVSLKNYTAASHTYLTESKVWRRRGHPNAALHVYVLAQQYASVAKIFIEKPTTASVAARNYSGARLEPKLGCYTGAFIDDETSLPNKITDEYGQPRHDVADFNKAFGIHFASYFIYLGYGRKFPQAWIDNLKANGAAAQIAWEPDSYAQVKDDAYLRDFAKKCKASGIPIFLRFASEMNGAWVPYHSNPAKYKKMFQVVAHVMHEDAPNVAMIWCPFEIPQHNMSQFYPGDDAVDWVGVNIYSVLYNDNDPTRNAQLRNPADALQYVYDRYAKKKPIMIGEYAAAHESSLDMKPRSDYAILKMNQFYSSLPLLYPRVKAIHWLSMNAIRHAPTGRQLNDYSLLEDPDLVQAFHDVNASPYFLKQWEPKATSPIEYRPVEQGLVLSGKVNLDAWVKTYENQPTAVWLIDGHEILRSSMPGMYPLQLDTSRIKNGTHRLSLVVLDEEGYEATRTDVQVRVVN